VIAQRRIALTMALLQLALYAFLSETLFFSVTMAVIAVIGFTRRFYFRMTQSRVVIYGLLLGGAFVARWYLSPLSTMAINVFFMDLGYSLAQYFLTLQVILLYLKREEGLYTAYPLLGVAAFIVMGDLLPSTTQNMVYHASALFFVALSAYFFSATRQRQFLVRPHKARSLAPALLLVVILGFAAIFNTLLARYVNEIDAAFANFMYPVPPQLENGTRLSEQVRLGSVGETKGSGGMKIALRAYSEQAPNYMRGRAFDAYRGPNWLSRSGSTTMGPVDPDAQPNRLFPLMNRPDAEQKTRTEIWPDKTMGDIVFTDLYTSYVAAPTDTLRVDAHHIASAGGLRPAAPYVLYHDFSPTTDDPPQDDLREQLIALPSDIDPGVVALADTLFQDADTPEEKIGSVVKYFVDNYQYKLGLRVPPDQDPLTYFLLERPAAHCEYFASGAAILLRLGGVPCRYVTGFVAREKNPVGGYWVARSRDAHAWVEAWVDGTGWVIVETTPAIGVPQGESASKTSYAWDDVKHRLTQLKEALLGGSVSRAIRTAFQIAKRTVLAIVTSPVGLFFVLLPVIAIVLLRWIFRRREQLLLRDLDPDAELHALLRTVDESVAKRGITRDTAETLHRFAERLETEIQADDGLHGAGDWYRDYAAARYRPDSSRDAWETLRSRAEPLIHAKL
jgi:protein-glutamine gamma-glutamyltransferase